MRMDATELGLIVGLICVVVIVAITALAPAAPDHLCPKLTNRITQDTP